MLHQLDRSSIKLHDGEQMLYGFLSKLIFRASVASIFNESRCEEEGLYEAFHTWDSHMAMAAGGMSLNYFPKAAKARDLLTNMCAQHSDDLSEFMLARWKYFSELEKEGKMLKGEQEKEHLAIFWASLANTMPATFWILYYLMHHEQALKDVLTEVHKVFPSPDHEISQEDMNQMTFTDAVITEALRLSTGSLIMRIVRNPVTLTLANGKAYRFRKGDRVGLCPPVFHYDEDFFPKAKEFNPYRWMTGDTPEERVSASLGKMPLKKDGKEISRLVVLLYSYVVMAVFSWLFVFH